MLPASALDPQNITWDYFDKAFWLSSSNMHTVIELLILIGGQLSNILARLDALEAEISDLWTALNNAQTNISDIWGSISDIYGSIADLWSDSIEHTETEQFLLNLIQHYHPAAE